MGPDGTIFHMKSECFTHWVTRTVFIYTDWSSIHFLPLDEACSKAGIVIATGWAIYWIIFPNEVPYCYFPEILENSEFIDIAKASATDLIDGVDCMMLLYRVRENIFLWLKWFSTRNVNKSCNFHRIIWFWLLDCSRVNTSTLHYFVPIFEDTCYIYHVY